LHHARFHRARDVRGSPARGVRRALDSSAAPGLLPGVGFERDSRHRDQDHRDSRGGVRFLRPGSPQGGRLDFFHRDRDGADVQVPRRSCQDRHRGLVLVRIDLRQHRLERHDGGHGDDSADEARGVPPASRRRDRSLRLDGGPDHSPRHGDRGLHHGRVSPGALLRSRPGGGHTRAPFLCRALHPGGPGGGEEQDPADAQGGYPAARPGSQRGWYFLLPLAALVYALFGLNYEPEMAGLVATAIVLALGVVFPFRGKRIGFRDLYAMLRDAGTSVLDLFMLGAAAGVMIGALNYSGVGFTLTLVLILLAGGSLVALLVLSAIANIILGLGLPTVGVYIVLATLVAPALVKMGIDPMASHMFIMYYGCLSMISPPVAIAAFVAANLAGADPNRTGWVAMAFGWTLFVIPFLFVFSGTLLLKGDPLSIAVDLSLAVAGVWFISAA